MTPIQDRWLMQLAVAAMIATLGPRAKGQTPAPPSITIPASYAGQYGENFALYYNFSLQSQQTRFSATGLPPGLQQVSNAGVIDGVPTQTGTFTTTVQASDPSGSASATVVITISHATEWAAIPAVPGVYIPANLTRDGAGNSYSFTAGALIKTDSSGKAATIATAQVYQPSPSVTVADFAFTDAAVDGSGNVYAAETNNGLGGNADPGELIVKVSPSGIVTTTDVSISANPALTAPNCRIAPDDSGNVFTIAPDYSVRELLADGTLLTCASQATFNAPDGSSTYPTGLNQNGGIAFTTGDLYPTSYSGTIELVPSGPNSFVFSVFATAAQLGGTPLGVATDPSGNIHITVRASSGEALDTLSASGALTASPVASVLPSASQPFVRTGNNAALDAAGDFFFIAPGLPPITPNGGAILETRPDGTTVTVVGVSTSTESLFNTSMTATVYSGSVGFTLDDQGNIFSSQEALGVSPSEVMIGNDDENVPLPEIGGVYEFDASGQGALTTGIQPAPPAIGAFHGITYGLAAGNVFEVAPAFETLDLFGLPLSPDPNNGQNATSMAIDGKGRMYVVENGAVYVAEIQLVSPVPEILFQPQSAEIPVGGSAALSVTAIADPGPDPISYQWFQDGTAIPSANTSSYAATVAGSYFVRVSTPAGSSTSAPATVNEVTSGGGVVGAAPLIVTQPGPTAIAYGGSAVLSVAAVSTAALSYQWELDGQPIPGATDSSYAATGPGSYSVLLSSGVPATQVESDSTAVTLANRMTNISSRVDVSTGAEIGIAGFSVSGGPGTSKQVLVRAVGPGLAGFGITGFLASPTLTVFNASGQPVATNEGWGANPAIAAASQAAGAFALTPGSADAAIVIDLAPGAYTAEVSGVGGTTGTALVEVYETFADFDNFINISTRAFVGTGSNIMIGGLVVGGTQATQVLIRAAGPALSGFGVSNPLVQPTLSVFDAHGNLVAINTGWSDGGSAQAVAVADAAKQVGAFGFSAGSSDCALLLTLAPGAYTAQVSGAGGSTGVALVEAYQVPQSP